MGDFASPAAGPNGSICINSGMNPAAGSVVPGGAVGITKHSTVVERLRQRIEGCRRHHVTCENRYQQAHTEQLEIERRETVSLYQRSLEQRAKKSAGGGGGGGGSGGGSKQPQSKQPEPDSASSTEQRNNTLIAVRTSSQSRPKVATRGTQPHYTHTLYTPSFISLPPKQQQQKTLGYPPSLFPQIHHLFTKLVENTECWKMG